MATHSLATVRFDFHEDKPISAFDLGAFLFDFNRMYASFVRFESEGKFPRGFNRKTFDLPKEQELKIEKIRFESPGILEVTGAITAICSILVACKHYGFWPLEEKKLKLEIEKLEAEANERKLRQMEEAASSRDTPQIAQR